MHAQGDPSNPVYHFTNPIEFLQFEFQNKQKRNRQFSLRSWARQLGYENPSLLSSVLHRKRKLNSTLADKVARNLKLDSNAKKYFDVLVLLDNSKTPEEREIYNEVLSRHRPAQARAPQSLGLDVFHVISDWYHLAILEMLELKSFRNDISHIARLLAFPVTTSEIANAIKRLVKIGLVKKSQGNTLKRNKDNSILIETPVPAQAIQTFHRQMLELAAESLSSQSINEREFRGSMISLKRDDYLAIQKIIAEAHRKLVGHSCKGNGDELYYFATQLFKVTNSENIIPSKLNLNKTAIKKEVL